MFHTVYDSFEEVQGGRDYIGKHSSEDPYDTYLGSFVDDSFNPTGKIILGYSKTPEGAVWLEIQYQRAFGVAEDPQFANRVYQTSEKFDSTGLKWSEEAKQRSSQIQREVQNRPEVKEKKSRNITTAVNDPSVKAKHKEAMQRIGKNPQVQAKKVASKKASGKVPNLTESWKVNQRESQKVSQNRPETKALKSKRIKERMQDPDVQAKIKSRSNDHNRGRKWFTNGKESAMYFPGEEPSDWRTGRVYNRKN
jgi:hypothetical protein